MMSAQTVYALSRICLCYCTTEYNNIIAIGRICPVRKEIMTKVTLGESTTNSQRRVGAFQAFAGSRDCPIVHRERSFEIDTCKAFSSKDD
jgi:hypothetical protein